MNNQTYTPIHKFNGGIGATICIGCSVVICTGLENILYCDNCTEPSERYLKELGKTKQTMKEEYYLIKKDALDAICSHSKQTLEIPVNNDCKLIDLSDEAIIEKANESFKEQLKSYEDDLMDYPDHSVFKLIYGYKQALKDLKQKI